LPHGAHGWAAYFESVEAASEAGAPAAAEDGKQGRSNANFEFGLGGDHCGAVEALHLLWAVKNDLPQHVALTYEPLRGARGFAHAQGCTCGTSPS
jgi:hypothetical protein